MLTDTQCKAAKPKDKPYKLPDFKGLYLEVKPNGVKAWRYRFKLKVEGRDKESIFAIGEYAPPKDESLASAEARRAGRRFTLAEARTEREKARALVKQQISPVKHRQFEKVKQQHAAAITFESVANEWLALQDWEEVTKVRRKDMLERVVFPKIGDLPVNQVTSHHVLDVLQTAAKKNGISVANEAKRTMSRIFDLAVSTLRAVTDPTYAVRKALPANKTQHKPALSIEDIGKILRDVTENHHGRHETVAAFRLMWLTLCRPSEAVCAEWSEFDLDKAVWHIPARRMKKRRDHRMLLPTQAIELLRSMHAISGKRVHVFPGRDNPKEPFSVAALRQMLNKLGWAKKFSPHAVRTTGSTRLNELGFSGDWIERQLAHIEPNAVRRTYNHAEYFSERGVMMQQWADMLDKWKSDAPVEPQKIQET